MIQTALPDVPIRAEPMPCILATRDGHWTGRLRDLSAAGAVVEMAGRPGIGEVSALACPNVGTIVAHVSGHREDGIVLRFALSEDAQAFCLAAAAVRLSMPKAANA